MVGFKNVQDVPISLEELEREYCRLTTQPYPIREMVFTRSWMLFRVRPLTPYSLATTDTMRGIACCHCARHRSAVRKTSGELREGALIRHHVPVHRRAGVACCAGR